MKDIVLITGANGSIAKNLTRLLENTYEIRFLTRMKKNTNDFEWNIDKKTIDPDGLRGVQYIIHLAGASVADGKWTEARKREIVSSRVDSAKLMLEVLQQNNWRIKSFISASAVGIYGDHTSEKIFTEDGPFGTDFLAEVVKQWEAAADLFEEKNVAERVVKIRIPVVLSAAEGALKKMSAPVDLGIGSAIGSGKQYMPWVHISDLSKIFTFALKNNLEGVYNAAAPEHLDNKKFMQTLATVKNKPFFMPNVPEFVLKIVFGAMSSILLNGSRVSSEKLQNAGFRFEFEQLKSALKDLYVKEK